jgi:hypothetical protein
MMKKLSLVLLILGALAVPAAFAEEPGVLERARDGTKKGVDATVRAVKKGADATERGAKHAGEWIEKKTGKHPPPKEAPKAIPVTN